MWFAARGWQHPAWLSSFYPEDMPQEWQLAYYSNEFRSVVLPSEEFCSAKPAQVELWVNECGEGFRFIVELDGQQDLATQIVKLNLLRPRLGALILPATATSPTSPFIYEGKNKGMYEGRYATLQENFEDLPCYYLAAVPVSDAKPGLSTPSVQWITDSSVERVQGQLLFLGEKQVNPRRLRGLLEDLMKQGEQQACVGLISAAAVPNLELLRQAEQIYHLLKPTH